MLAIAKLHPVEETPPEDIQIVIISKSNQSYFAELKSDGNYWLDPYSTLDKDQIKGWFDLDDIYIR